jgi:pathogenesis-related protein 1
MLRVLLYGLVALMIIGCGGGSSGNGNGSGGNGNGSVGSTAGTTPDALVAKSMSDVNVTSDEQGEIVERHNLYRDLIKEATLPDLVWDDELAMHAQTWANYLAENYSDDDAKSGQSPHANDYQASSHSEDEHYEGENIGFSTKRIGFVDTANGPIDTSLEYVYDAKNGEEELLDVDGVIDAWASEAYYYDYATNKSNTLGKPVGHYTQIIWKNTTKVGCGKAIAKKFEFNNVYYEIQVCRYSLPGNIIGEKPY